jgi:UDP-N-acetylglucosamine/UDP-N-acetyl-alpha-D-glucosaminouronate 4-epimerase
MHALVTGGAGFIGSHLVNLLLESGAQVTVLDDLSTGFHEQVNEGASFIEGDVADREVVNRAVAGCNVVFHLAAHRAVLRSVEHPLETDRANVAGTLTILVASRDAGVRRIVFASSSSVYGGAEQLPTPETAPLTPRSPYAVSKLAGEHYCRVFWELFGLETVALRYFNVYGPRQRPNSRYAAVIPIFVHAIRSGRPAEIHGDGRQTRDFTFVEDAVRATILAALAPAERCAGKAYNLAGGHPYSLLELLALLEKVIGIDAKLEHTAPRPGDVRDTQADVRAAAADVGYRPEVGFEEGLRRTAAWFAAVEGQIRA